MPLPPLSGSGAGPLGPRPGLGSMPGKASPQGGESSAASKQAPTAPNLGDRQSLEVGGVAAPSPHAGLDAAMDDLVVDDAALEAATALTGPALSEAEWWAQSPEAPPLGQAPFRRLGEAFGG